MAIDVYIRNLLFIYVFQLPTTTLGYIKQRRPTIYWRTPHPPVFGGKWLKIQTSRQPGTSCLPARAWPTVPALE